MSFVLDTSATAAWIHSDEFTPALDRVFAEVMAKEAWVPQLWTIEVANVLVMNVRKHRYDSAARDQYLAILHQLPVQVDLHTRDFAWTTTIQLAEEHRLTAYDATYLELAVRLNLPLITLDKQLREAAKRLNVPLRGFEPSRPSSE